MFERYIYKFQAMLYYLKKVNFSYNFKRLFETMVSGSLKLTFNLLVV